jgi:hypothetical protein
LDAAAFLKQVGFIVVLESAIIGDISGRWRTNAHFPS